MGLIRGQVESLQDEMTVVQSKRRGRREEEAIVKDVNASAESSHQEVDAVFTLLSARRGPELV
jgi:hypothetical protein